MSRKRLFLFISLFFLLSAGGIYLFIKKPWQKQAEKPPEVKLVTYESEKFDFKLTYPEGFVVGKIPEEKQGEKDPVMLRLVRLNSPTLVTLWKETGLGMLDLTIKKPLLYYLKSNIDKKYGHDYNDFKKETVEDTTLSGLEAFTVWFTFQNPEKEYREKIKQTITVKDKVGIHLQCMAPEEMWKFAEPNCDIIKDSFEFIEKEE